MLRLIFFAAIGALLGGAVVEYVGPPGAGWLIMGIALPVAIVSGVFVLVGRSLAGGVAASPAAVTDARDVGRFGLARIDALSQTGTQINDQPLCDIDLTVQPLVGSAYATTLRSIVPLTELPAFQPGALREVVLLLDGGPEVAFVDGEIAPAKRAGIVVPARSAVPFVAMPRYSRISDGRRRGPLLGVGRSGRPLRVVAYLLVAVLAGAAVTLPHQEAVGQTIAALRDGRLHPDLRDADTLAQARAALEREIGHDQVASIVILPDLVIVDAPIAAGSTRTDQWMYRGGQVSHDGAAPTQPDSTAEFFSWSDIAPGGIRSALDQASEESGLPVDDASVSFRRSPDGDIQSATFAEPVGPVQLSFSLDDDYDSAFFRAAADGSGLTRS
ncbi:MAG: hypothetical protein PGN24_00715 [Microbacterium arborescens]